MTTFPFAENGSKVLANFIGSASRGGYDRLVLACLRRNRTRMSFRMR